MAKGYYKSDEELVQIVKDKITGKKNYKDNFKTIECDIMDIADDIAYSTFDLEDSFKAGFINPINFAVIRPEILSKVHQKTIENTELSNLTEKEIQDILKSFISSYFKRENYTEFEGADLNDNKWLIPMMGLFYAGAKDLCNVGYVRYQYTSAMIDEFIEGISVEVNEDIPALSKIKVEKSVRKKIECVKHFVFYSITMSNRLRIPEYRGYEIVSTIIDKLGQTSPKKGFEILPVDFRAIYDKKKDEGHKKRVICDFVAGMTDKYVVEFYGRLTSENPQTIFKST